MKHLFCVLFSFLCLSIALVAQEDTGDEALIGFQPDTWVKENNIIPASPEASSLGKYGETPVNYYTGSPNINIPIHTLSGQYINLPVSLSFDVSNIKVTTVPSWVGMGWSLNAGGAIARTVQGLPDTQENYYKWGEQVNYGTIQNPDYQLRKFESETITGEEGKRNIEEFLTAYVDDIVTNEIMQEVIEGRIDLQPDVFNYNIPGYSGSFVITREREFIFKEHTDLEFQINWGTNSQINSFTIRTPTGVKYFFSNVEKTEVDMVNDSDGVANPLSGSYNCNSAWYLTSITSSDNSESIYLNYYQESAPYIQPFNPLLGESKTVTIGGDNCPNISINTQTNYGVVVTNKIINRKFVKEIQLRLGGQRVEKLTFSNSVPDGFFVNGAQTNKIQSGGKKLDNILLERQWIGGSWQKTKRFDFVYTPANSTELYEVTGRLSLFEIQEKGYDDQEQIVTDENQIKKHQFGYAYGELPEFIHAKQDHWGYYGNNSTSSLDYLDSYLPTTISNPNIVPVVTNRKPGNSVAGVLNSITYPTGGSTTFEYEAHTIEGEDNNPLLDGKVGGLRLKSIEDDPGSGPSIRRTFKYVTENGEPSGRFLQKTLQYVTNPRFESVCISGSAGDTECQDYTCIQRTVFAQSQSDVRGMSSNHIGYSRVEEILGEESANPNTSNNIGKTIYSFVNNYLGGEFWENKNGTLYKVEVKDKNGQTVKQTDYNYNYYGFNACPGDRCIISTPTAAVRSALVQSNEKVLCHLANGTIEWRVQPNAPIYDPPCGTGCIAKLFTTYNELGKRATIKQLWKTLDSEVTTETFYENGPQTVVSTKSYEYDGICINSPTYTSFTNSDGTVYGTEMTYYEDCDSPQPPTADLPDIRAIPTKVIKTAGNDGFIGGLVYDYDGDGRVLSVRELFQSDGVDGAGTLRMSISGYTLGRPDDYTYMSFPTEELTWSKGLLIKREQADWTWEYDYYEKRTLKTLTEIDGQSISYDYDALLRLNDISSREGNIHTTLEYQWGGDNSISEVTEYSDAPTNSITRNFDGLGRPTFTIHNGIKKEEYIYDEFGRLQEETYLPGSLTAHKYDFSPLIRRWESIFPDNESLRYIPDAENNMYKTTVVDEKGNETTTYTDILGRTIETVNAIGGETTYMYEARGHLKQVNPPGQGGAYIYTYDDRNRLVTKKIPGQEQANVYRYFNTNDLLAYSIDPNGNRTDYTYDQYGREKLVKLAELGDSFDATDELSWGSPGDIIIQNQYAEDESSSTTIQTGKMLWTESRLLLPGGLGDFTRTTFGYDNYGRVKLQGEKYPLGGGMQNDIMTFSLNHADWVESEKLIHNGYTPINSVTTTYNYDVFGRTVGRVFGANKPQAMSWSITYNERDEMTSKKLGSAGALYLDKIDYQYHIRGWLTHMNDIVHEEGEAEFCEESDIDNAPNQVETTVDLDGLLDLITTGADIDVEGLEECTDVVVSDCYIECGDRFAMGEIEDVTGKAIIGFTINLIYVNGQAVQLPNAPYEFIYDPEATPNLIANDQQQFSTDFSDYVYDNYMHCAGEPFHQFTVEEDFPMRKVKFKTGFTSIDVQLQRVVGFYRVGNVNYPMDQKFVVTNLTKYPCPEPPPLGEGENFGNPFPTVLYKVVKTEGGSEWVFKDDLSNIPIEYSRLQRLSILDATQQFLVTPVNGETTTMDAVTLKEYLVEGQIQEIEPLTETDCTLSSLPCSESEILLQNQSVEQIMNEMASMDVSNLQGPIKLYVVKLCDGSTIYILGDDLLGDLEGNHVIIDQMTIDDPQNIIFEVVQTLQKPLFAMRFTHEANGNISNMKWKVTDHTAKYYDHTYDMLNRLQGSAYGQIIKQPSNNGPTLPYEDNNNHFTVFGIDYDGVGNILSLTRYGMKPDGDCFDHGIIDDLTYTYANGRLIRMQDDAPADFKAFGFKPKIGAENSDYEYDKNGNITYDPHKGLTIEYNHLNLPKRVLGNGGDIQMVYDASGRKWKKVATQAGVSTTKEYVFGIEYVDQNIESIYTAEGRLVPNFDASGTTIESYRAEYWRQDHLGNTRLAFSDFNGDGVIEFKDDPNTPEDDIEIVQENHYYPFGMNQVGDWYATTAPENKYQYNGKELNEELGLNWNDYGARYYDPAIARWNAVDMLADDPMQIDKSVYAYAWNNPNVFTDPDGNIPNPITGFIIGFAADITVQALNNIANGKGAFEEINLTSAVLSGSVGALTSGFSVFQTGLGGTSLATAESVSKQLLDDDTVISLASGDTKALQDNWNNLSLEQTASDVIAGELGGQVKVFDDNAMKGLNNKARRTARENRNNPKPARQVDAKDAKDAVNFAERSNKYVEGVGGNVAQEVSNSVRGVINPDRERMFAPRINSGQTARDNTRVNSIVDPNLKL